MKKILLIALFGLICIFSFASTSPSVKKLSLIEKQNVEITKLPYRCFDLSVYTLCGYVWQGDVCVNTELH